MVSKGWKKEFANKATEAIKHPLVERVIEEYADNMRNNYQVDLSKGLPSYGLMKVMNALAQVARAQALDIDPQLLVMTEDEVAASQLRLARDMAEQGRR